MKEEILTAKTDYMKLEKSYTTYRIESWDGGCPVCRSKNSHVTFRSEGSWYKKFHCDDCGLNYAFNQGDAMGGQSDYIEIYEPGKF